MKSIQKYTSIFLLASCMFVAVPSQAKGNVAIQLKDAVRANPYVSASIMAGILIGSCLYLKKRFFSGSIAVQPSVKQNGKPSVKQKLDIEDVASGESVEAVEEQTSPSTHVLVDGDQEKQVIKVTNDQGQTLQVCVSKDNDDPMEHFLVPSYSYAEIRN